ncbi:hypothetical protein [Virgisporangium aliadipatigenens]|nr:hypothetical protein [Virgisporangium aliadipatigenens]
MEQLKAQLDEIRESVDLADVFDEISAKTSCCTDMSGAPSE